MIVFLDERAACCGAFIQDEHPPGALQDAAIGINAKLTDLPAPPRAAGWGVQGEGSSLPRHVGTHEKAAPGVPEAANSSHPDYLREMRSSTYGT
jgi:hypothetical protein